MYDALYGQCFPECLWKNCFVIDNPDVESVNPQKN